MAGRLEGKVAFITGAARGQGRSHAVRMAEEGADIIAIDICRQLDVVPIPMSTPEDLAETVDLVKARGRRIVAAQGDVRNFDDLKAVVDEGVAQFGRLDIVCANAGVYTVQPWDQVTPQVWQDTIDTNLTGVWNTIVVAVPHLIAAGGGSIIATSSTAGLKGMPFLPPTWRPSTPWSASAGRWPTSSPAITSGSTPCTQPGSIPRWSTDSRPSSRS